LIDRNVILVSHVPEIITTDDIIVSARPTLAIVAVATTGYGMTRQFECYTWYG
jgi:hypothetical protein